MPKRTLPPVRLPLDLKVGESAEHCYARHPEVKRKDRTQREPELTPNPRVRPGPVSRVPSMPDDTPRRRTTEPPTRMPRMAPRLPRMRDDTPRASGSYEMARGIARRRRRVR